MSAGVYAQIYTDVEPSNALKVFDGRVAGLRFPNELEMLVLDSEGYYSRNPTLKVEFLTTVYTRAQKLAANETERKFFGQRLSAAQTTDVRLTKVDEMVARLSVLEIEKAKVQGSPYTQPDSQMKMIFIAAGRALALSKQREIGFMYVQGRSQHSSLRGGRSFLETFLARAPRNSPYRADAEFRLADLKQKDGDE